MSRGKKTRKRNANANDLKPGDTIRVLYEGKYYEACVQKIVATGIRVNYLQDGARELILWDEVPFRVKNECKREEPAIESLVPQPSAPPLTPPWLPTDARKSCRVQFSEKEEKYLREGIEKYGNKWAIILKKFPFNSRRTNVDLKDKWRNILKFSKEEEVYLKRGIEKYGCGNWAEILKDKEFPFNCKRTIVDLKYKWQNKHNPKKLRKKPKEAVPNKRCKENINKIKLQEKRLDLCVRMESLVLELYSVDRSIEDIQLQEALPLSERKAYEHLIRTNKFCSIQTGSALRKRHDKYCKDNNIEREYLRKKWSKEEENYLIEGIEKYGVGNWALILSKYPFSSQRSN
eukprot:g4346.t1